MISNTEGGNMVVHGIVFGPDSNEKRIADTLNGAGLSDMAHDIEDKWIEVLSNYEFREEAEFLLGETKDMISQMIVLLKDVKLKMDEITFSEESL